MLSTTKVRLTKNIWRLNKSKVKRKKKWKLIKICSRIWICL